MGFAWGGWCRLLGGLLVVILTGCASPNGPARVAASATPGGFFRDDGPIDGHHVDLDRVADAVPRSEPIQPRTTRAYEVLGRRYEPMGALAPYRVQGVASWYGRRYHGRQTASGERYDMFTMSAAHPILPIPSYARVTALRSGRSVVVRINDRGPFVNDRLIDLSYAAAHRLGLLASGTGEVEVQLLLPDGAPAAAMSPAGPVLPLIGVGATQVVPLVDLGDRVAQVDATGRWLQLGAFSGLESAGAARERLARALGWPVDRLEVLNQGVWFKVQAGPFGVGQGLADAIERVADLTGSRPFVVVR